MNKILQISDTLSGNKVPYEPLNKDKISMYVCGVTPYDHAHVGHGRCYVTFDLLYRLLKNLGYNVKYCRNFTDVDDKLLNKAEKELGDRLRYKEIADKFIDSFNEDIKKLQCKIPNFEPRVTETIPEIIDLIQSLIDNGKAYVVDGDVYFAVRSFKDYGKLSKRKLEDLKVGARVDINDKKKDSLDFALWKAEKEGDFWKSPWGYGRPGWHIECSAMAKKFLGNQIDLHAGGMDLIFPHHENEIAQTEACTGEQFSKYWMHNAFVQIDKEKMSKSLGNFFTLKDVLKKFDPQVVRYYYLSHSYNVPLDFSFDELEKIQKSYKRLVNIFDEVDSSQVIQESAVVNKMEKFLLDDLNTPGMFGVLFENLDILKNNKLEAAAVKKFLQDVLGLQLLSIKEKAVEITPEIQKLIDERLEAREQKNWSRADELRDQLISMGLELKDRSI